MTHETPQEESLPRNVVLFAGDVGLNTYFITPNTVVLLIDQKAIC